MTTWKLEKTLFSRKIQFHHFFVGIFSFLTLVLMFSMNINDYAISGARPEIWRAFISSFLHADLDHLFHNAFFFTGLGILLNTYFGSLVFPVLSFATGILINLMTVHFYPPEATLVGVSGVVYFMAAFWLTSFILIERRQPIKNRIIYSIGMALIFFFPETFKPQVSYLAHGIGFGFGIVVCLIYFAVNFHKIRSQEEWVEIIKEEDSSFEEESSLDSMIN